MSELTGERLAELGRLAGECRRGPWVWQDKGGYHELVCPLPGETGPDGERAYNVVHSDGSAAGEFPPDIAVRGPEAALMAVARTAIPELVAECVRLRAENAGLKELVAHCWVHSGYRDCGFDQMDSQTRELYRRVIAAAIRDNRAPAELPTAPAS